MVEKKSSEILLDLDNRIINIEKQLKLQEFQLRIIIDNFNKMFKTLPAVEPKVEPKAEPKVEPKAEIKAEKIKTKEIIPIIKGVISQNRKVAFEEEQGLTTESSGQRKIPVTQVLKFSNGDPVGYASVLITDVKGDVVKKVNTNTVGRWQVILLPGKYVVAVHGDSSTNPEVIEFTQAFEVSNNSQTIILPVPESIQK
jgi:hypothetical protein